MNALPGQSDLDAVLRDSRMEAALGDFELDFGGLLGAFNPLVLLEGRHEPRVETDFLYWNHAEFTATPTGYPDEDTQGAYRISLIAEDMFLPFDLTSEERDAFFDMAALDYTDLDLRPEFAPDDPIGPFHTICVHYEPPGADRTQIIPLVRPFADLPRPNPDEDPAALPLIENVEGSAAGEGMPGTEAAHDDPPAGCGPAQDASDDDRPTPKTGSRSAWKTKASACPMPHSTRHSRSRCWVGSYSARYDYRKCRHRKCHNQNSREPIWSLAK